MPFIEEGSRRHAYLPREFGPADAAIREKTMRRNNAEVLHRRPLGRSGDAQDPRRDQSRPPKPSPATSRSARPPTSTGRSAAREAFATFSQTSREERIELLQRILAEYQKRFGDMANAITEEMGAPACLAQRAQAAMGSAALRHRASRC